MRPELRLATPGDIGILVSLVGAYHEFEGIDLVPEARAGAIMPLLERDDLGRIWFCCHGSNIPCAGVWRARANRRPNLGLAAATDTLEFGAPP